jgi:hypothetical protein
MRRNERTTYQHAGVTLVRVPGEEKLQVKTTRERTATAEAPTDAGGDASAGKSEDSTPDVTEGADGE